MLICISMAFLFPLSVSHSVKAQVAGLNTLAVFDLSSVGRTAGVGMDYLALFDDDLTIGIDNPSLLRSSMAGSGVLSFIPMFDGSNMGSLTYAHKFDRFGTVAFGFHFVN